MSNYKPRVAVNTLSTGKEGTAASFTVAKVLTDKLASNGLAKPLNITEICMGIISLVNLTRSAHR